MHVRRVLAVPSSLALALVSVVLAGAGVVGSAAPAGAQSDAGAGAGPLGMAVVVHGLVDFPADVYLDGSSTPALSGFEFRRVTEPLALPAGVHRADLRRAGEPATAPPTLSGSFVVTADERVTVAALLDARGVPSWLAFPDDAAVRGGAQGELRVRHFAATGPVAVSVDGDVVLEGAANLARAGQSAPLVVSPGQHRVAIIDQATRAVLVAEQAVDVAAGGAANLYLTGTAEGGLALLQESVEPPGAALGKLQAVPSSVPGGNSGLAAASTGVSFLSVARVHAARAMATLAQPAPRPASTLTGAVAPTAWGGVLPGGALAVGAPGSEPRRVRIPAIALDAPVLAAGVGSDGALGLPGDVVHAGWFEGGAQPGESGSAVIAAHVDLDGAEGVFFRLSEVPSGSVVEIERADGSVVVFRTSAGARQHAKSSLPLDELFRRGGAPVLRLMTCGGPFDPVTRSYRDNVVVDAVPSGDLGQPRAGDELIDAA